MILLLRSHDRPISKKNFVFLCFQRAHGGYKSLYFNLASSKSLWLQIEGQLGISKCIHSRHGSCKGCFKDFDRWFISIHIVYKLHLAYKFHLHTKDILHVYLLSRSEVLKASWVPYPSKWTHMDSNRKFIGHLSDTDETMASKHPVASIIFRLRGASIFVTRVTRT